MLAPMLAAAPAGAASVTTPDLSGLWSRTSFGLEQPDSGPGPVRTLSRRSEGAGDFNVADEHSPILKPAAVAAVRRRNETERRGLDYPSPSNQCLPMAAPYVFRVQGLEVVQKYNEILLLYMQDHQIRHVRLNATHPTNVTPSWYGDSVGHFEGDTLVVDTIGAKPGPAPEVDALGTPFGAGMHLIERYRLVDYETARRAQESNVRENGDVATEQAAAIDPNYRGKGLQVQFTVDDREFFTTPWSGVATYRRAGSPWMENVCAENTHEYYNGTLTKIPQANAPDF
jgi:hypothetical protein